MIRGSDDGDGSEGQANERGRNGLPPTPLDRLPFRRKKAALAEAREAGVCPQGERESERESERKEFPVA